MKEDRSRHLGSRWAVGLEVVGFGCNPWRWYRGIGEVHMSKGRVGEDRGSKETDGCPLTSPATFQTMMNEIFQDLITQGVVSVHLDDILIFTSSIEEHRCITHLVLDRMHEHKLYL
jgi:hypothetical protein